MIDTVSKKGHHVKTFVTTAAKRSANQSTRSTIWWERGLRHVEAVQWSTNALWSWQQELQQHVVSTSLTSWKKNTIYFPVISSSWITAKDVTYFKCQVPIIWWCNQRFGRCCHDHSYIECKDALSRSQHGCQLLQVALTKVSMLALFQSLSADQVQISALFFRVLILYI